MGCTHPIAQSRMHSYVTQLGLDRSESKALTLTFRSKVMTCLTI